MPELALGAESTLLPVGTPLRICAADTRLDSQEVLQTGSILAERILNRHECLIDERVHEHPLLYHLLEVLAVIQILLEVVVRHNDTA